MTKNNRLARDYINNNKHKIVFIVLIGIIQSCMTFLLPISIGEFFSLHFQVSSSKGRLLQILGIHFASLPEFFTFFLVLLLFKGIVLLAEKWLSLMEGEKFIRLVREKLFSTQINQPADIFKNKSYGNYLLRYSNDMKAVKNYLLSGVLGALKNVIFLLFGIILLGLIHFKLAACMFTLFIIFLAGAFFIARYQKRFIQKSRDKRSSLLALVTKSFSRHTKIKLEQSQPETISRFKEKSEQLYAANLKNYQFESLLQSGIPFLQYAMLGGILLITTVITPSINHGDTLVFVLVTLMLFSSMRKILKVPGILNKGNISLQKIEELMQPQTVQAKALYTAVVG